MDGLKWQTYFERSGIITIAVGPSMANNVAIKASKNTGTTHYNYKGYLSIVLLGVSDGNYKFLWVEVGAEQSVSGRHFQQRPTKR